MTHYAINMLSDIFTQTMKPFGFIWHIINRPEIVNSYYLYIFSYFLYIWISSASRRFVIEKLCCNENIWIPSKHTDYRTEQFMITILRGITNILYYAGLLVTAVFFLIVVITFTLTIVYFIINMVSSFFTCIERELFLGIVLLVLIFVFSIICLIAFFSLWIPILRSWYSNTLERICYTKNYWIQVLLIKIKRHYIPLLSDTDLLNSAMFLIGKGMLNDRVSVPSSFRKVESYYPQSIENTYQAITKLSAQLPLSDNKYQHLLILEYVYFFALNHQKQFSFFQVKTQPVDNLNEHVIISKKGLNF